MNNPIVFSKRFLSYLKGECTPQEAEEIKLLLNESEDLRNLEQELRNKTYISRQIAHMQQFDVESALQSVYAKTGEPLEVESENSEVRGMRNLLKYAAAILVLVIANAGYWYSQYIKVTPPEISEAVQLAMQQSIQSGKQEGLSEELRVKSEESFGSEELRVKSEESFESEELRVKSEEYLENDKRRTNSEESPAKNFSHPFNNSSSLFTLHSSLNITSSLTKDQLLAAKRITTKHDKEFWLTLDDGTLVHLNYNTRLIYPEKFGRGDRNVILDGEAYFMVAKDKSRPFIVHTPNGDVKVYGTEFNVNTRTEVRGERLRVGELGSGMKIRGERIESSTGERMQDIPLTSNTTSVVLVKGSVSVTPTGGKETMLKPGQQATVNVQSSMPNVQSSMVNGQSSTVNVTYVDLEPYIAWNTGDFIFHNWTLRQIMDVMAKWYNVSVEFSSEDIANQKFYGSFSRYDNIQSTMETIESVTGHTIQINNNHIIIKK